ncbi:MAG: tetratricopeptide repeat protein [Qipengyuania sp.]
MLFSAVIPLLIMQVGPNPTVGAIPGVPEEMRDRPPRENAAPEAAQQQRSRLSQCLMRAGSDAQAALDYAQAWREMAEPGELAQTSHCAGLALVRLGRFDEALQAFEAAREELEEPNPAYRARLGGMAGHAAMAKGDSAAALPYFESAVEDAVASADARLVAGLQVDMARALVSQQRPEDAAKALERARSEDPSNVRAWLLSATLSRRLERLGEAQRQIEYAATLDPRDPAIGLEAGVIAALAGREEDARRSFQSVLDVAPESEEAERARTYLAQLPADGGGP